MRLRIKVRRKILSLEEFHSLLGALVQKKMDREWFLVFVLGKTGIKIGELKRLTPSHLFFEGPEKTIAIPMFIESKWKVVEHPVSGEVAGVMERWVRKNEIPDHGRIFPHTLRTATNMVNRAFREAGLDISGGTMSLRHLYGVTVARATGDLSHVVRALRRRDVRVARRYLFLSMGRCDK